MMHMPSILPIFAIYLLSIFWTIYIGSVFHHVDTSQQLGRFMELIVFDASDQGIHSLRPHSCRDIHCLFSSNKRDWYRLNIIT